MIKRFEEAIDNRYEFVILFDVENGNPNGDPDADNAPRVDPATGYGIVTDVCIKRKIRNYVQMIKDDESPYKIFVKELLNDKQEEAYDVSGLKKNKKAPAEDIKIAQEFMCKNYFDIRAFGAVMSTGDAPCGVVRGPIQLNFAKSIDPIEGQEITITRKAVTNKKDAEKGATMGKKNFIPYALYKMEGYISAKLAQDITGFNDEDLSIFFDAIINMFEHDHSAARGKMVVRKLIVFKHRDALGNCPSHKLFDRINVKKKDEVVIPRKYDDYDKIIDTDNMPEGVELIDYDDRL